MASYEKKIIARDLRKRGLPLNEIVKITGISKSTISHWCRDIVLTEEQFKVIKSNHMFKTLKGRMKGAMVNKQKRLDAISNAEINAKKLVKTINKRELLLVAIALYWSEGSKSERTTGFQFINSDPEMITCMYNFLMGFGINKKDIACTIQINKAHESRITKVLSFWRNLLDLDSNQIGKPYFITTVNKKVYENHDSYFGICRLKVRKSTKLKYDILGLIKALKSNISPM